MALHNKHRTLASFEAGVLISRIRGGQGLKEASVDGENALCMAEIRVGNYKSKGARADKITICVLGPSCLEALLCSVEVAFFVAQGEVPILCLFSVKRPR